MDDDAQAGAWQRIEAALTRLDGAARNGRDHAAAERAALERQLQHEQARHTALRGALRETLGRIDALIATHNVEVIGTGQPATSAQDEPA